MKATADAWVALEDEEDEDEGDGEEVMQALFKEEEGEGEETDEDSDSEADLRAVLVHPTLPTLSNSCVKKGNLDTLPVIVRLTLLATKLLREINDNK